MTGLNQTEALWVSNITGKRVKKILLILVLVFLGMHLVLSQIDAYEIVNFSSEWDSLTGYGRFLNPNLHFELDIQELHWNNPIEKAFFGITYFLFMLYKTLTRLFVIAYYYVVTFNLSDILKPAVLEIFGTLKKVFIDDFRSFLTSFLLLGVAVHYGKQNFQKIGKTLLNFFLLIAVAGTLVTSGDAIYDTIFDTVQEINGAVTTSVITGDDVVDDPFLESTGAFWYTLFVEPYTELNGEGKLSLSQTEELIAHPSGSSERDALIVTYNDEYNVFSRSMFNSLQKAGSVIVVAIVVIVEVAVILSIAATALVHQLLLLILFALLPVVLALATIEFFGGLSILRRYGIEAGKTLLTMIMVGVVLGFTFLLNSAVATIPINLVIKMLMRAMIYVLLYKYHDRLFNMLSNLLGLHSMGFDPTMDMPQFNRNGRGKESRRDRRDRKRGYSNGNNDDSDDDAENRKPPAPLDEPRSADSSNRSGKGVNPISEPKSPGNETSSKNTQDPTGKQMKFARDLEKQNGVENPNDLSDMSREELSDYIDRFKEPEAMATEETSYETDDTRYDDTEQEPTPHNTPTGKHEPNHDKTNENSHDVTSQNTPKRQNAPTAVKLDEPKQIPDVEQNSSESAPQRRTSAYKHKHRNLYKEASKHDINLDPIDLDELNPFEQAQLEFELQAGYSGGMIKKHQPANVRSTIDLYDTQRNQAVDTIEHEGIARESELDATLEAERLIKESEAKAIVDELNKF